MFNKKWIRNAVVAIGLLITFLMIAANTIQVRENPTFLEKGLRIAASPFQNVFRTIDDGLDGVLMYFADKKAIQQENAVLQEKGGKL